MKKIEANIIADSISPQGHRITSMLLTFPRFILAELNTHRLFSRNSASSRAIPFEKMVKMVEEDPFIPIAWQKPHKGMQGAEYYDHTLTEEIGGLDYTNLPRRWLRARDTAISMAKIMADERMNMPVTKQLCNRLLEPFMWHTVLVTATEWENFFELRCPQYHAPENSIETKGRIFKSKKDMIQFYINNDFKIGAGALKLWTSIDWLKINYSQAEIHIQALAESMWDAMNESTPQELKEGQWHIPFNDSIVSFAKDDNIKISTARCARLSYMTFDNEIDYGKDIKLHDRLLKSGHMSPFEHCARAMTLAEYKTFLKGKILTQGCETEQMEEGYSEDLYIPNNTQGWCNNFRGWIQYRYLIENK